MEQTREPSDSENTCASHLCITRIWKKGIKEAALYFSSEAIENDPRDRVVVNKDDELEFDDMMEENVDDYKED